MRGWVRVVAGGVREAPVKLLAPPVPESPLLPSRRQEVAAYRPSPPRRCSDLAAGEPLEPNGEGST